MTPQAEELVLFVGAGFSFSAGLPLTKDLFAEIPHSPYFNYKSVFEQVRLAWLRHGAGKSPELWIREVYLEKDNLPEFKYGVSWEDVQDGSVVKLPKGSNAHYYHGISASISSPVHREFWSKIRRAFHLKTVITTNYDLLIEQGLKSEYKEERTAPICSYGGYPYLQVVRKMTNVTTNESIDLKLGHEVELIKLHGSLNWVQEPHGYKIHDDVRAVFRKSRGLGKPRIIPPLEEKERPEWSFDIWNAAEAALTKTNKWFVCGYSFPHYDIAINKMIAKCGSNHKQLKVIIADPYSSSVKSHLEVLLPKTTEYLLLPGLP
jgi:NAD-dependent SIR2 family protein deacetylase